MTPSDLAACVLRGIEAITGRAPDPASSATAARPILALWRALERPALEPFGCDLALVASAAHRAPDRIFAHDLRAEAWAGGRDRSRSTTTICVQDRWEERLAAARAWDERGQRRAREPTPKQLEVSEVDSELSLYRQGLLDEEDLGEATLEQLRRVAK